MVPSPLKNSSHSALPAGKLRGREGAASPLLRRLRALWSGGWPYVFTTVAPLVLYAPFWLGQQVLYWGTPLLQFYPWRKLALDQLLAGQWPLWNPYLGNGAPLLANLQSAVFYPPNWLALVLPLDSALSWLVVLHWIWAGAGMVSLTRSLGLKPLGQAVAGLAFGLCQYLVARAWFFSINATVAWVPWVIWWADRCLRAATWPERGRRGTGLAVGVALQLLAGHAQTAWYTLLLLGAWALWRTVGAWRQTGRALAALLRAAFLVVPLAAGGLLAAVQLLPTAELLSQSPRATAAAYEFVMNYSFSPWRLLTLLAPDLLGNPARAQFYGYGNYWEDAAYLGLLPLGLAAGALGRALLPARRPAPWPHRGLVRLLALVAAAAVALALGRNTPLFLFFYAHVPTFNLFQAPARMMVWFEFAVALLAGLGADHWPRPEGQARRWLLRAAVGSVSVIITGFAFMLMVPVASQLGPQFQTAARALALLGLTLLGALWLALIQPAEATQPAQAAWEWGVAAFIAVDLIWAGAGLSPGAPPDLYRTPTASGAALRAALGGHRLFQFSDDEQRVFSQFWSFRSFGSPEVARSVRETQLANAGLLDGLAAVNNYEPLVSARYAQLLDVISTTRSLNLLRLMDVSVLASQAGQSLPLLGTAGMVDFYQVPGEVRRVRVVYAERRVPDAAAAFAALAAPNFDSDREVILEANDPGVLPGAPLPLTGQPPGHLLTASATAYTISVSLSQAGWVVVADTCYPGWGAFVDGTAAPLRCANGAFRAVAVAAGEHVVEFQYRPQSFVVGLWLSAASWLAVAVMGLVAFARTLRRRSLDG